MPTQLRNDCPPASYKLQYNDVGKSHLEIGPNDRCKGSVNVCTA
jgi:hypothetical protein